MKYGKSVPKHNTIEAVCDIFVLSHCLLVHKAIARQLDNTIKPLLVALSCYRLVQNSLTR